MQQNVKPHQSPYIMGSGLRPCPSVCLSHQHWRLLTIARGRRCYSWCNYFCRHDRGLSCQPIGVMHLFSWFRSRLYIYWCCCT